MKIGKNIAVDNNINRIFFTVSIFFLILTLFAFAGFKVYDIAIKDKTAPVVTVPSGILEVSVKVTETDLLKDISAIDDKAGDVSNTLMIEKMSSINTNNERTVYYVAIDKYNNVGKAERVIHYTDYKLPEFTMDNGCFIVKNDATINILNYIKASSVVDGDITSFLKYSFDSKLDTSTLGEYPVQFYVTDSAGGVSKLDTTLVVATENDLHEKIKLKHYLVYINVGDEFDPASYVISGSYEGDLEIDSQVNTNQKGTYTVDYYVTNNTKYNTYKGRSRLIVIVK